MKTHLPSEDVEELKTAISASIVGLYNTHFPRRVTMAETFIDKDVVLCLLEAIFDDREHELIENGGERALLAGRAEIQEELREEFSSAVEKVTERRVIAFMSANHADPALAAEVFVLEPKPRSALARDHAPSRCARQALVSRSSGGLDVKRRGSARRSPS